MQIPKPSLFQFSLRSLLVATAIVCGALALIRLQELEICVSILFFGAVVYALFRCRVDRGRPFAYFVRVTLIVALGHVVGCVLACRTWFQEPVLASAFSDSLETFFELALLASLTGMAGLPVSWFIGYLSLGNTEQPPSWPLLGAAIVSFLFGWLLVSEFLDYIVPALD